MSDQKSTASKNEDGDLLDDVVGTRQWKRSRLGWLTGVGAVREAVGDVGRMGSESKARVTGLFGALRRGDKSGVAVNVPTQDAMELFEKAALVNRKSDVDIAHSVANTYRQFWLYAALTLASVLFAVIPVFVWGYAFPGMWPLELAFRAMLIPLTGALAFRAAYTNWVFRRRSMDSASVFLESGNYLPERVSQPSRRTKGSLFAAALIAFGIAFSYGSSEAVAETSDLQSPQNLAEQFFSGPRDDDLFTVLMSYVVPDVGPIKANGEISNAPQYRAIKSGFFFFSATLLFVGANLVGWQIISSIVASAKEGSMMGRRYHEVWAPIRTVVGFGMLAPIAGGFCAAQVVVIYLVVWGGNLANLVWNPYIENISVSSTTNMQTRAIADMEYMSTRSAMNVAEQVITRGLCNETIKSYYERTDAPVASNDQFVSFNPETGPRFVSADANNGRRVAGGSRTNRNQQRFEINYGRVCGSIFLQFAPRGNDHRTDGQSAVANVIMANAQMRAIENLITVLHKDFIVPAAQSYQSYSTGDGFRFFSNESSTDALRQGMLRVRTAINEYDAVMMTAATQVYNMENPYASSEGGVSVGPVEQMRRDAITQGWAGSGMFYATLARLQNAIYEMATQSIQSTPMDFENASNIDGSLSRSLFGTLENPNGVLNQFQTWWQDGQYSAVQAVSTDGMRVANETTEFGEFLSGIFEPLVIFFEEDRNPHILNPMQDMVDMGNKMLYTGLAGFTVAKIAEASPAKAGALAGGASAGVIGAIKGFVAGGILGDLIAPFASLAVIISFILMAAGIIHAFVIPMVPYVMTVFFVASMLVLIIEALVAAPIWAFLHIRLDGDEFVDQVQKPGYMIAFNLILRPTLMIFGLIFSMLIFGAMVFFVSTTFIPAMRGMGATNGIGIFGFIVMLVMLCYLHFQTAVRAFSLILRLPDRVTRWFGQGGENLGEEQDAERTTAVLIGGTERRFSDAGAGFGQRRTSIPSGGAKALASGATGGSTGAAAGAAGASGAAKTGGGGGDKPAPADHKGGGNE